MELELGTVEGIGELETQVRAGILGPADLHAAEQLRRPARRYRLDELLTTCEGTKLSARCRKSTKMEFEDLAG